MIRHHPDDDLLLPLAAGRLALGPALVVGAHLEGCTECRGRVQALRAIGGALLDDAEPMALAPGALDKALATIAATPQQRLAIAPATAPATTTSTAPGPTSAPASTSVAAPLPMPAGVRWPASLRGCRSDGWRWMGPGMRYARLAVPGDPGARVFLLRIGEGRSLASHTHTGMELTQVMVGQFDDGRARFAAGDFDHTDEDVHHQPIVATGGECICLAYVEGPLRFDGRIASTIGRWIGM